MGCFPLLGPDQHSWSQPNVSDLVQLQHREGSDLFSRWVNESLVPLFHQTIGKHLQVLFFSTLIPLLYVLERADESHNLGVSYKLGPHTFDDPRVHTVWRIADSRNVLRNQPTIIP